MAQAGLVLDKDQFNCSICLDVLKDPVTIPCGHSYCSVCIKGYWEDDYMGVCCPQCRQAFNPRPLLGRNTMLADVVERFKKTSLQSEGAPSFAGPEDVECDVCTGRKNKAVKSCLVCLASYCESHLQPHYDSAAFKKHRLVVASKKLQETICPHHDKLLEFYCRTDQKCVCYLCVTNEHKGHDTVLAETEIHEKQAQLGELQKSSQRRIQTREKEVQELRQAMASLSRSARVAVEDSEEVFSQLIRSVELKRFELRELIQVQEEAALKEAQGLLGRLEAELAELRRRDAELERLSRAEDHVHFLQSCQALRTSPGSGGDLPAVTVDPNFTFVSVMVAVSDFRGLLEEVCQGGFVGIYEKVRDVSILVSPEGSVASEPTHQNVSTETGPQIVPTETAPQIVPTETAPQIETTQAPPAGDQSSAGLNPFLNQGATGQSFLNQSATGQSFLNQSATGQTFLSGATGQPFGGFAFSMLGTGSKLSGPRHRPLQRRSHPRRK